VLLPLAGATLRSALAVPGDTTGIELRGEGLAFGAAKPAEAPGWIVLRCTNLLETMVRGSWRTGLPIREAFTARLDETRIAALPARGTAVEFEAKPREVVTLLVKTDGVFPSHFSFSPPLPSSQW
jgi:hypothetical protein